MWNDNASIIDILFFEPYSNVVYSIVKDKDNTPVTIGLFGSWGAGKSSVLNFIEKKINNSGRSENICCIKINAWLLEGYDDAKLGVVEAVLEAIKDKETFFQTIKDGIVNLIKKVNWLKVAKMIGKNGVPIVLSMLSNNPIPAFSSVVSTFASGLSNDAVEGGDDLVKDDTASIEKNVREIRNDFESLLSKSQINNLVVMIDDLDRCSPDRIMDVLEAVKLFLSVKKTTFVFAVDEAIIRYSINRKYNGDDSYSNEKIAQDYIEKIIQIPIILPYLSSKDIENYLLLLYYQSQFEETEFGSILARINKKQLLIKEKQIEPEDLDSIIKELRYQPRGDKAIFDKTKETICNVRKVVSGSLKGNPRQAKRFLNAFFVKKELASYYSGAIDENILAKLMALYLIDQSAFNELNEWNMDYDGSIKQLESLEKGEGFEKHKLWEKENLKKWLESEPRELHKQNLNKYFYLTKEYLADKDYTHLHLDQYKDHKRIYDSLKSSGNYYLCVSNSVENFVSLSYYYNEHANIRFALGANPTFLKEEFFDLESFRHHLNKTRYIGEVGLDFSSRYVSNKQYQLKVFNQVLAAISGTNKILSVHSNCAEQEIYQMLKKHNLGAQSIIHWYSGSIVDCKLLSSLGCYFSLNGNMADRPGFSELVKRIGHDRILIESDGPHTRMSRYYSGRTIEQIYKRINDILRIDGFEMIVFRNFQRLLTT